MSDGMMEGDPRTVEEMSDPVINEGEGRAPDTHRFAHQTVLLASGAIVANGILLLSQPLTSRMFAPEAFGRTATFFSVASIVGTVACLRYEMAIVLPKRHEEAGRLFILCGIILTAISLVMLLMTLLFGPAVLVALDATSLQPVLWLIPFAVFFGGADMLLRNWHTRLQRFGSIAVSRLAYALPRVSAEVGGGVLGFTSAASLVLFGAVGMVGPPLFLLWRMLHRDLPIIRHFSVPEMWSSAGRYAKFPAYDSTATLLLLVSWQSPLILLPAFYGSGTAGLFAKALYLLYLPVMLIGESVGQVFLQMSAERKAAGADLADIVEAAMSRMISVGVIVFSLSLLIGPDLFMVTLGDRWVEAGIYARILSPWMFILLLHSSIESLFGTLNRQDAGLAFNAGLCLTRLAVLVFGGWALSNARWTIGMLTAMSTLIILWRCHYLLRQVGASGKRLLAHLLRSMLVAFPGLLITAYIKWPMGASAVVVVGVGIAASIPSLFVMLRREASVKRFLAGEKRTANRVSST